VQQRIRKKCEYPEEPVACSEQRLGVAATGRQCKWPPCQVLTRCLCAGSTAPVALHYCSCTFAARSPGLCHDRGSRWCICATGLLFVMNMHASGECRCIVLWHVWYVPGIMHVRL
jgi:hypothetical protein